MARIFGRVFGKGGLLAHARALELQGELARAAAQFAKAGRLDEAARVMILRGDAETDPPSRLRHYVQAVATAPAGSSVGTHARRRRSSTVVAMAADAPMTEALRQDLAGAASELEAIGEHAGAAEAFARAGDVEGQARALAKAGDVDALDQLLAGQLTRDRETIARHRAQDEIMMLVASGQRREAAAMARAFADEALRERGRPIELSRIAQSVVNVTLRGKSLAIVLGDAIVIGRALEQEGSHARTGTITVASATIGRRHVAITRTGGEPVVRDLGSRNATLLRGLALSGDAPIGDGIELRLGGDVPLVVRPTSELGGAVAIDVVGMHFIAPLGPAVLGVGRWRLDRGDDGWVELVTDDQPPPFSGSLRLVMRVTLLAGDSFAAERGGTPVLRMDDHVR
jgi:hypothetical protein